MRKTIIDICLCTLSFPSVTFHFNQMDEKVFKFKYFSVFLNIENMIQENVSVIK